MPLRPSQVETLRAIDSLSGEGAVSTSDVRWYLGASKYSHSQIYRRLRRAEIEGKATHEVLWGGNGIGHALWELTQLGKEALEGQK